MTDIANTDQFDSWNGESGLRWVADPDRRDRVLQPVADALLEAAGLNAGEHVLDIGCGCGATTLAAARAVAARGAVLGADLSEPMLAVAKRRAADAGVDNVRFEQADAQIHRFGDATFDVAVSRFGTMFFADPAVAFANVARSVRPDGRLVIATWQPLLANDWLTVPGAALLRFGSMPDEAEGPGMFAQSDPSVITAALAAAGFDDIRVGAMAVTLTLGADPADAAGYLADSGPGRAVLDTIPEADRPTALAAVQAVLADHTTSTGVHLRAGIWVTRAHRA
jgi:ubiquinone/menaquinone biosynthesis C-methylase UbiE